MYINNFMINYFNKLPNDIQIKILIMIPNWNPKFKIGDIVKDNIFNSLHLYQHTKSSRQQKINLSYYQNINKFIIVNIIKYNFHEGFAYYIKHLTKNKQQNTFTVKRNEHFLIPFKN